MQLFLVESPEESSMNSKVAAVGFSSDWNWCGFKFQCCCVSYIDPSGWLFNQVSYIYSLHSSTCAWKIHLV